MDDITQKRLARAIKNLPNQSIKASPKVKRKRVNSVFVIAVVLVIIAGLLSAWRLFIFEQKPTLSTQNAPVVPNSVSRQVNFVVPYPEQNKLPVGYKLNVNSFSSTEQAVVYSVTYGQGDMIAITVQKKPSDDELKTFYANQIPIRNEVKAPLGMAAIGVINDQTFASLPTESDAWLLITAPKDIDQNDLKKVLQAMRTD